MSALVLLPGLSLLVLTQRDSVPVTVVSVLEPVLLILTALFALIAVWLTTQELNNTALRPDGSFCLLRPDLRKQALKEIPDPEERRALLSQRLDVARQAGLSRTSAEPITLDEAIGRSLRRVLNAWGRREIRDATDEETLDLAILTKVVLGTPQDAGRLAQLFLKPDQVLNIRQELISVRKSHQAFTRQRDQFNAARTLWQMRSNDTCALVDSLERLAVQDPDLWHHVVMHHQPRFRAQSEAALWCLRQSDCDQATVAAFFKRIVDERLLQRAARVENRAYLSAVASIIRAWNKGEYTESELAFSIAGQADSYRDGLAAELAAVTAILSEFDVAAPSGMFKDYPGRPARSRSHWSLTRGTITRIPRTDEYIEDQGTAA